MSVVFFTDRNLGNRFPDILAQAGLKVERHRDHFAHDCPDEEWLRTIGERGWIAITHDRRIRYKPNELTAVRDNRVALLVLVGHAPFHELAESFVATFPRVEAFIVRQHPPYIAKIYRAPAGGHADDPLAPGRVELWYPS